MKANRDPGLVSLRTRAVWARSLIGVFIAVYTLFLLWAAYTLWRELSTGFAMSYLLLAPLASPVGLAAFLAAMIPVLLWVHRAHANLLESGVDDHAFAPGWAVASLLVPGINLIVPPTAMRQLWNRSNGEDVYQADSAVGDVAAWWACFIAGNLIQAWLIFVHGLNTLTNLVVLTPAGVNPGLAVASIGLLIASAVYLFRIIGAITKAQGQMTGVAQAFA